MVSINKNIVYSAVQTGGHEGKINSTGIALSFGDTVTNLTADDITISNDTDSVTKGELSGNGMEWIIDLASVVSAGNITVSINKPGIKTVSVFKAPPYFVAVAYGSNKAACSLDGIEWVETTLPAHKDWNEVCYGDGIYITVAYDSDEIAYSPDGVT
jgi:hypothetical protein